MLIGCLSDLDRHEKILPHAVFRALKIVRSIGQGTAAGRFPLEGEMLYYTLEEQPMRTEKESLPEVHTSYADIHLPLNTRERFGFALPQPDLPIVEDLTESRDIAFYATPSNETFITAEPGTYLLFLPGELHRPCLAASSPATEQTIRKIIVKIHASLLGLLDKNGNSGVK
ncbi:MAG: YhcH/YjgK/YiaL family protein [Candidatus Accumulibacter sp.]|jgi:biofilm protein TabA|nr:YhcH/YjgK/YiaL family protein [Accumulibacter sp.]